MDFFESQDAARRQTRRLVLLFLLAVVAIVLAVYLAVVVAFSLQAPETGLSAFHPALFAAVAALTLAVVGTGSVYKTSALSRGGGEAVASLLGGRPVSPDTRDPAERRLLNVVEEMAIAAGMPVPTVYLLEREGGINAFAAGLSRDDAVVGVTRGCLAHLTREELQGVMAHEASHILNGDMRLNLRLIGLLHGILVISLVGYWLLRSGGGRGMSRDRRGGGAALLVFGIALLVIGWVGVFFGRLIKSGVSRQRELLADAAAVQFTRNPQGLAMALKKIGGLAAGSRLETPRAEEASHLFFSKGAPGGMFAWMSTHPPLAQRIRRLDPAWDGTYPAPAAAAEARRAEPATGGGPPPRRDPLEALRLPGLPAASGSAGGQGSPAAWLPAVLAAVGNPSAAHLRHAGALLAALPAELAAGAHQPSSARAVVAALLLSEEEAVRGRQLELATKADPALGEELRTLRSAARELPAEARLPLVDLALPALRRLSPEQYASFRALLGELARADERLSLFEYALHKVLVRHLDPVHSRHQPPRADIHSLRSHGPECSVLLSALAHAGHAGEDAAVAAFSRAAEELGEGIAEVALLPRRETTFSRLDRALDELSRVAPPHRRRVLAAAAACVAWDGQVTVQESELLRAIADALDCPMPPLLPGLLGGTAPGAAPSPRERGRSDTAGRA
jgi:Zn-dependent protease with chaperone function